MNEFRHKINELLEEEKILKIHLTGLEKLSENFKKDQELFTIKRTADESLRKYSAMVCALYRLGCILLFLKYED
jgi:hypothetical protein